MYKDDADEILSDWVNTPTDEFFTPLHFAAFRGHLVNFT